ncbi:MAG TPA: class I SAM-dependent methyltransferase [Acidimicrobiales bacterium]|nr:class I SAM-dependent methyltransferase [Acidimicrobiales bacterium]
MGLAGEAQAPAFEKRRGTAARCTNFIARVPEQRLVFGEDPHLYHRARPTYPSALIDEIVSLVGSSAHALDVGCGTGKATVLLAERGLTGVALDADPAMAAVARLNLAGFPEWEVQVSDFEKWHPSPRTTFDLVTCAQAWHWLDPLSRLHKAHELLRPGGWLALWWNGAAPPNEMGYQINAIYTEITPEIATKSETGFGRQAPNDDIPAGLSFAVPLERSYEWAKDYTPDEWVALLRTQSDHRLLPPERLDELTARIRELITANGGTYCHNYVCRLWAVQRL